MSNNKGFTLVELSIVLVVIGLIVAGVVSGQILVQQAQVRKISNDFSKYDTAFNAFFLKFNAIPGDMDNAHDYWGASCDATPANCNGDGNKQITYGSGSANESWRGWQHLQLADLINASLTGSGTGGEAVLDVNTPRGPLNNGGFYLRYGTGGSQSLIASFAFEGTNFIGYGASRSTNINNTAVLTPAQSHNIDTKIDDGLPYAGGVRAAGGFDGAASHYSTCVDGSGSSATYNRDLESVVCILGKQVKD